MRVKSQEQGKDKSYDAVFGVYCACVRVFGVCVCVCYLSTRLVMTLHQVTSLSTVTSKGVQFISSSEGMVIASPVF